MSLVDDGRHNVGVTTSLTARDAQNWRSSRRNSPNPNIYSGCCGGGRAGGGPFFVAARQPIQVNLLLLISNGRLVTNCVTLRIIVSPRDRPDHLAH